jgi:hypothetical protein
MSIELTLYILSVIISMMVMVTGILFTFREIKVSDIGILLYPFIPVVNLIVMIIILLLVVEDFVNDKGWMNKPLFKLKEK